MEYTEDNREQEIKKLLKEDPQAAIVLMVEHYTSLIWVVCGRYLANPEDIKECVNDTFATFYWQRENFDESKGNLVSFLCGIARHHAISHYRKNKRYEEGRRYGNAKGDGRKGEDSQIEGEEAGCLDSKLEGTDDRLDLEQALDTLKAEDAEIIRMKYYGGMTVQEIADSLNLPYETVKKRHQRSLGKLRGWMLATLILLLVAALVACAYVALQHFGIIPGYGINRSDEMSFYVIAEMPERENELMFARLESGVLSEESFVLSLYVEHRGRNDPTVPDFEGIELILEDGMVYSGTIHESVSPADLDHRDENRERLELTLEPLKELPKDKETISMILRISGLELPVIFEKAKEEKLEEYSYALGSQGGVLAIPKLENGRLYVDIYPLSCGIYTTEPGLIRSVFETAGGPKEEVTVTGEDGIVRTGECLRYRPFSTDAFFRWDFGPAEPGTYQLDIPYVYQSAETGGASFSVSDVEPGIGQRIQVPGSCLTVTAYSKEQPEGTDYQTAGDQEVRELRRFLSYDVETEEPDRILVWAGLEFEMERKDDEKFYFSSSTGLWKQEENYTTLVGHTVQLLEDYDETDPVIIWLEEGKSFVMYRWNHAFSIPIQVEEE